MSLDRTGCAAPRHGTAGAYRAGCRCADARAAKRRYTKQRQAGISPPAHIDATGTRRRLQALMAIGHSTNTVAAATGLSPEMVTHLRGAARARRHRDRVSRATAFVVWRAYESLSMVPGLDVRSRTDAARLGHHPPLAWDDAAIDDPHARPVTVLAARRDVQGEARFLASFGESFEQIAKQLGVQATSIERAVYRARRVAS